MVFDQIRNQAYARALEQAVFPGCTVLDLGAGLGIHGLMAARMGAAKVYLVDPSPAVRHAIDIARCNGLGDRIEVIRGRIEEIELPEQVDLIVSVFTGNFLLTEDLLPLLLYARDRWLKPGGRLVPDQARMQIALVSAAGLHAERVACWSEPVCGLDFTPMRKFAANAVYFVRAEQCDAALQSTPATPLELDFATATTAACKSQFELAVGLGGTCHGLLGWFDMHLGEGWVSTAPQAAPMHWSVAFLPADPVLELQAGEIIRCAIDRPEFGEWSWTIEHAGSQQRNSTFNARLADLAMLKSQADSFIPGVGEQGEVALFVLDHMAHGFTTGKILVAARTQFAGRYKMPGQLDRLVRGLIAAWRKNHD